MAASLPRHRFSVGEYQQLGTAQIFSTEARVELVDGEIVEMSPIGPLHVWAVTLLSDHVGAQARPHGLLSVQNPIRLGEYDEPQPDLTLIRRDATPGAPLTARDVLLVIEIADSSRAYDRETKLRRYAAAGIPEAWLADLVGKVLERYSEPRDGLYRQIALGRPGDTLSSTVIPDLAIPVNLALGLPD
ncbi:MAG TPA: Uma2 family endonuclease [Thermomicrobiales bacterium]|jgi:Uma2 family endonuclease